MGTCRKDTGANLKGFPLAKYGTIWVSKSITKGRDYNTLNNNPKTHIDTEKGEVLGEEERGETSFYTQR